MRDNPIRLLLIEDSPGDMLLIKEMLNEVRSAKLILEWRDRLSTGLQKLNERGTDVVLTDLGLPDSQGLETYQKLHASFPGLPIIVMSGLNDESVAVKAVRDGAQDYLVKGQIEGNLLTRSIMYAIERKRTESLLRARMRLMDFAASHSLDEVLQETVDEVGEIVDSPIGFYHFVGDDQKTLSLQAWSTRTLKEFCTISGKGLHYHVENAGVWVDCIHKRGPVIHNNYISLPHRKGMPEGHVQVIRELVVPIMRSDRVVAILGVGNKPSNYTEKDVELVTYMADVAWQIAEQKRAEQAIIQAKEEWERTFASVPDLIAIIDSQHRIIQVNNAMARRLGKLPEECAGLTCFKEVHGMNEPPSFCPHSATMKDGKPHSIEIHEDSLGGDFVVTATPLYDGNRQRIGSVHVAHDITERKDAEKALQKAHDELEIRVADRTAELVTANKALDAEIIERQYYADRQAQLIRELEIINRELDDFAHIISHDLKAPLRAIKSLSEWVLQDHADAIGESGKEKIQLLNDRIDHLRNLIDGILEYSRAGKLSNEVAKADLNDLATKVINSLSFPKNIRITIDNQLPIVACDMVRIGQVFQNLVDNAVKYMDKQEGEIRIRCAGDDKQWTFSVADNGPGIDRKHYYRIFQLFKSLHGEGEKKGMGVGLAIVKKIVEMHGGRVWVESEVGRGSTFFFTLPRQATSGVTEQ
jgi:PAS domain S-box-containing protein